MTKSPFDNLRPGQIPSRRNHTEKNSDSLHPTSSNIHEEKPAPPSPDASARVPATLRHTSPSKNVPSIYRSMANEQKNKRTGLRVMQGITAWADQVSVAMESPVTPQNAASPDALAHRSIRTATLLSFILFGIIGMWAAFWPLATGAIAVGKVVIDTNRKTLQHLEGGIVKEILVREGQNVKQGDVLLRLDSTGATARRDVQRSQYIAAKAAEARLIAERDGQSTITFPQELLALESSDSEVHEQLATQRRLFETRRTNNTEQVSMLGQRVGQTQSDVAGLREQVASASEQLRLLQDEIDTVKSLVASGNAVKSRLLALQRNAAQIQGQRGQALSSIARANQQANEARIEITNKKTEFLNNVIAELKDAQVQASSLGEQMRAADDVVRRIDIKAPISGQVVSLNVHTVGGVIAPGEKLLDIVPANDKLVIEAQINPQDIDIVHVGLPAQVRLSAYKQRRIHPVSGKVITVSADRIENPQTGQAYFNARVEIPASEFNDLKDVKMTPGMPAEVMVVTGSRTMFGYLFDPLSHSFGRAFHEE